MQISQLEQEKAWPQTLTVQAGKWALAARNPGARETCPFGYQDGQPCHCPGCKTALGHCSLVLLAGSMGKRDC